MNTKPPTPNTGEKTAPKPNRAVRWLVWVMAGLFAWVSLVAGAVAWRLTAGPISLDWLTPHIEQALNKNKTPNSPHYAIGKTIFIWSKGANFIEFQVQDFTITSGAKTIAHLPRVAVSFDMARLLWGDIAVRSLSLKSPTLAITRYADGRFSLQGGADKSNNHGELHHIAQTLLGTGGDTNNPLKSISIENAHLTFTEDFRGFKWIAPTLNATIARDGANTTVTAQSNIALSTRTMQGNIAVWSPPAKTGAVGGTYRMQTMPNAPPKRTMVADMDNLDMRFLLQFFAPQSFPLNHPEPVSGIVDMHAPNGWIPHNTVLDLKGQFGTIQGSVGFEPTAQLLNTDLDFKGMQTGQLYEFIKTIAPPHTMPINVMDTTLDFSLKTQGLSFTQGGSIAINLTTTNGIFNAPPALQKPFAFDPITAQATIRVGGLWENAKTSQNGGIIRTVAVDLSTTNFNASLSHNAPKNTVNADVQINALNASVIQDIADAIAPKLGAEMTKLGTFDTVLDIDVNTLEFSLNTGGAVDIALASTGGDLTLNSVFMHTLPLEPSLLKTTLNIALNPPHAPSPIQSVMVKNGVFSTALLGSPIRGTLTGTYPIAPAPKTPKRYAQTQTAITAHISPMPMETVRLLTPTSANPTLKSWLLDHLSDGTAQARATLNLTSNTIATAQKIANLSGSITADNMTIARYFKNYPTLKNVAFNGTFDKNSITLNTTTAHIDRTTIAPDKTGTIAVAPSTVVLGNLATAPTLGLNVNLTAPIGDVLQVVQTNVNAVQSIPITPQNVYGTVAGTVRLSAPIDDIATAPVLVNARGENLQLDYPDWGIHKANIKRATLTMDKNGTKLNANGVLNNAPLRFDWQATARHKNPTVTDKINITATLGNPQYGADKIKFAPYVQGDVPVQAQLHRYAKSGNWTLNALGDLQQSWLRLPHIVWGKESDTPATLQIGGIITDKWQKLQLDTIALSADESPSLDSLADKFSHLKNTPTPVVPAHQITPSPLTFVGGIDVDLTAGRISKISAERLHTSDFDLTGLYERTDGTLDFNVSGRRGNMQYVRTHFGRLNGGNSNAPTLTINAKLDTLTFGNRGAVDNFNLAWQKFPQHTQDFQLTFTQQGQSEQSYILFRPHGSGHALDGKIQNVGELFHLMDTHNGLDGGTATLQGKRAKTLDPITGAFEISPYHLNKSPTFGRLLQAVSITGLLQALGDEGITFDTATSDFTYTNKVLRFEEGVTNNSNVGFTFSGGINLADNTVAMQGTAIPLYGLSKIIGMIPIIGTLVTGDEGVFAANYSIEGTLEKPDVSANPLSVLAPGILRKLFPSTADESVLKIKPDLTPVPENEPLISPQPPTQN